MSPLQKIAMGLLIVVLPAYFPRHPHPTWRIYDALPDPLGWALVILGILALRRASSLDLDIVVWLAAVALALSVPLWFPQVSHAIISGRSQQATDALRWGLSLPQTVFMLVLCRRISSAAARQQPRDRPTAGRFGVLMWGFVVALVAPVIVYGATDTTAPAATGETLTGPTAYVAALIGALQFALVLMLFLAHRRTWLGGPGPRPLPAPRKSDRKSDQKGDGA